MVQVKENIPMFEVRHNSISHGATTKHKAGIQKIRRHKGASPPVHSVHRIGLCRSDLLILFISILFIMRHNEERIKTQILSGLLSVDDISNIKLSLDEFYSEWLYSDLSISGTDRNTRMFHYQVMSDFLQQLDNVSSENPKS